MLVGPVVYSKSMPSYSYCTLLAIPAIQERIALYVLLMQQAGRFLMEFSMNIQRTVNRLIKVKIDALKCTFSFAVANDGAPETAMRPKFLATFGMATEQASKLGLGTNKTMISIFDSYQVIASREIMSSALCQCESPCH